MGHSMGGGVVLTYLLRPDSPYHAQSKTNHPPITLAGVLAYSPLITLAPNIRPSKLTLLSGRLAARIFPNWQRVSPLDTTLFTRDKQAADAFAADKLNHDIGTLEGLAAMLDRGLWLEHVSAADCAGAGSVPLWFAHGEADQITSCEGTRRLANLLSGKGDVTFCSYEGAYHVLHAELPAVKERFTRDLTKWVLERSSASGNEVKADRVQESERDEGIVIGSGDEKDVKARL